MKMYDVEVALAGGGDVNIMQDCGTGEMQIITLHPDQVPIVCEWLMGAIGAKKETRETVRFEN